VEHVQLILPRGKPWTPSDDRRLELAANSGRSASAVAADLGRSRAAVRARAWRLNVALAPEGPRWTDGQDAAIRQAAREGRSQVRTAVELGVSRYRLRQRAEALGLYWRPAPRSPIPFDRAERLRVRAALQRGRTLEDLSAELGRPARSIRRHAQRRGLWAQGRADTAA